MRKWPVSAEGASQFQMNGEPVVLFRTLLRSWVSPPHIPDWNRNIIQVLSYAFHVTEGDTLYMFAR